MSPIFYSVHTVRERIPPIAPLIATANPLSHALDAILNVGVFGLALDWRAYGAVLGLSAAAAFAAFACFRRLRPGFADVM
ncbi:MAG: hypothetical protein BWZ10_02456 [candidate division BRC1 bacterium ADurb.BinA364]|nr:MAG: hypothetical protein BWZ10_02456 [candidate division BRC1 bacterium ADurb.BinA364]